MPTRRRAFAVLAGLAATASAGLRARGQPANNAIYIVFVHKGAPPGVRDSDGLVLAVLKGLLSAGYSVRKPDDDRDTVGGPGIDYFHDDDLAAAQAVADIVNRAMPGRPAIKPRRQRVDNPPHYLGVWLF